MFAENRNMESADTTTQQLMFSLIELWKTSGKSQKEFCQQKDLAYHKFHYWFKKYNEEMNPDKDRTLSFSQVVIPEQFSSRSGIIELQYPDGRRLIFHQSVDASFLRALLN